MDWNTLTDINRLWNRSHRLNTPLTTINDFMDDRHNALELYIPELFNQTEDVCSIVLGNQKNNEPFSTAVFLFTQYIRLHIVVNRCCITVNWNILNRAQFVNFIKRAPTYMGCSFVWDACSFSRVEDNCSKQQAKQRTSMPMHPDPDWPTPMSANLASITTPCILSFIWCLL